MHLRTNFSSGEVHACRSLRRTRNTSRFSAISDICWLRTNMTPQQAGDAIIPPGPCATSGQFSRRVASRTGLPIFLGTFWTRDRTSVAGISPFGEAARHSALYEFHNCSLSAKCRTVNTLRKNVISAACTWDSSLSVTNIQSMRIGTKTDLKTVSFAVLESSRFVTTER